MNLRIRKYPRGWVVEIQKTRGVFFKRTYWTHFISVAGMEDEPWHFRTREDAMQEMLLKIKWQTIANSR